MNESPLGDTAGLTALAARLVALAAPGEELEVAVGRSVSTSIKAYRGDVESFTSATNYEVGIRVLVDGRQGFAHAGTFDDSVLREMLADARDNVGFAEPDQWNSLARPDGVAAVRQELWNDTVLAVPSADKVALAIELERMVLAGDSRIKGVRVSSYGDTANEFALASTAGISSAGRSTACWVSVSALASDGEETQIGGGVDLARDPADLDLSKAAQEAVEQSTRMLGARQTSSQRLTILLEPKMAATLLGIVGGTLTGEVVLKGRSPFADRRGEIVASPLLTLIDDPTDARSLAADMFDGEGLACRRNVLIENGVLAGFLHNSYTGRRSGGASTGSAVRSCRSLPGVGCQALAVEPGQLSFEELLAGIENGLLVQSMSGLHSGVNPISGDFSVGAEGLMIRGGELAEPVREITIASTLQRLLLGIEAVGSTIEWLPSGFGSAALRIGDVALSGS